MSLILLRNIYLFIKVLHFFLTQSYLKKTDKLLFDILTIRDYFTDLCTDNFVNICLDRVINRIYEEITNFNIISNIYDLFSQLLLKIF